MMWVKYHMCIRIRALPCAILCLMSVAMRQGMYKCRWCGYTMIAAQTTHVFQPVTIVNSQCYNEVCVLHMLYCSLS